MDRYVANIYVRPPTPQIWGILDFRDFGDFGFWGFWILDFGDFGFWSLGILDFGFCDKFWILHKKKKTVHAAPGRRIFASGKYAKTWVLHGVGRHPFFFCACFVCGKACYQAVVGAKPTRVMPCHGSCTET